MQTIVQPRSTRSRLLTFLVAFCALLSVLSACSSKGGAQANSSIDGVLTLNNAVAGAAVKAIATAGSKAKLATFDIDADVIKNIQAGKILFAVDQQPYLQGYLPVVFLNLYNTNANTVGGGRPVLTGPGFVTKDNADTVAKYAARGTR